MINYSQTDWNTWESIDISGDLWSQDPNIMPLFGSFSRVTFENILDWWLTGCPSGYFSTRKSVFLKKDSV